MRGGGGGGVVVSPSYTEAMLYLLLFALSSPVYSALTMSAYYKCIYMYVAHVFCNNVCYYMYVYTCMLPMYSVIMCATICTCTYIHVCCILLLYLRVAVCLYHDLSPRY